MSSYYIGFDSGTQGTKVAIYADDSRLVAEAFRAHQILYPKPGWAEMDANQFYRAAAEGISECVQKGKVDPKEVKGIPAAASSAASCLSMKAGMLPGPICFIWTAVLRPRPRKSLKAWSLFGSRKRQL